MVSNEETFLLYFQDFLRCNEFFIEKLEKFLSIRISLFDIYFVVDKDPMPSEKFSRKTIWKSMHTNKKNASSIKKNFLNFFLKVVDDPFFLTFNIISLCTM